MSLALNKPKLDNLTCDIWKSAERLRGKFKAYEYQGVILPIIVIRRLECVLLGWREAKRAEVLAKRLKLAEKELATLVKELELNLKQSPFSNKTDWTLRKVYEEGVELRPGDVLMTEGGDLDKLGRGYLWNGEIPGCLHQNHIFAVRCFLHKLKPMFLAHLTAAKYGRDYFEATGKKTTNLACTNANKVGEFPIPLPPLPEQEAICINLDEKLGELKRIGTGIEAQIATLTAYRKSLIHECVTGQRRITEADVARSRLSQDTRQVNSEPSEGIGRLGTKSADARQHFTDRPSRRL